MVDQSFADLEGDGLEPCAASAATRPPGAAARSPRATGLGVARLGFALAESRRLPHRSAPRSGLGRSPALPSRSGPARLPTAPGAKRQGSGSRWT